MQAIPICHSFAKTYRIRAAVLAAGLLFGWSSGAAQADITVPDCSALIGWAIAGQSQSDLSLSIGGQSELRDHQLYTFHGAFQSSDAAALFGSLGEDWNRQDVRNLGRALRRCKKDAADASAVAALEAANEWAEEAELYLGMSGRALEGAPEALAAIDAQPFSLPVLAFLKTLNEEFTLETFEALRGMLRDLPPPLRAGGLVEREIVGAWGHIPQHALQTELGPEVARQLDERRGQLAAIIMSEIDAATGKERDTVRALDDLAQSSMLELLDEDRVAEIKAEIETRRGGLSASTSAALEERLVAVGTGWDGINALQRLVSDPDLLTLPETERQIFRDRVLSKFPETIRSAIDETLLRMRDAPEGPRGLDRAINDYENQVGLMGDWAMEAELDAFKEAAVPLLREKAEEVLQSDYRPALRALPAEEENVVLLRRERARFERWPEPLTEIGRAFSAAAEGRANEIEEEIAAAEAGPLMGRIYRKTAGNILIEQLEFLDETRVLVTLFNGSVQAGTYEEISGNRVILTAEDAANFVLQRAGKRLESAQVTFERVQE